MDMTYEEMAAALEASGAYRVLRRLDPQAAVAPDAAAEGGETRNGLYLDLETTGLDPARHEIIEFAMVPFTYTIDGRITSIAEPFDRLREPAGPIPPDITALTGITDEMVRGKTISRDEVAAVAAPANLVIAHNAAFDRPFAEKFCDVFTTKPWACSMAQIPWAEEGFEGTKLGYLVNHAGYFFDAHRAGDDCLAALTLLGRTLPNSGRTGLDRLLENARQPICRVWAVNSPFDMKDQLKARGYRWNAEPNGKPRSWYRDVPPEALDVEITFLQKEIYQYDADIPVDRITAVDRFSTRVL